MYSQADFDDIARRIVRNRVKLAPAMLILAALMIAGYALRVQALAVGGAVALAAAACFGLLFVQMPCLRYQKFLRDMEAGLSREMTGTVVSIADTSEEQDGAQVLHVHIQLDDGDERIVYLNASKRALFPPVGTRVQMKLCGRHVREAVTL